MYEAYLYGSFGVLCCVYLAYTSNSICSFHKLCDGIGEKLLGDLLYLVIYWELQNVFQKVQKLCMEDRL